jgi:peptidoglycan/xylan/chitin deacetylase (PgdA/CDA1 family)
MYHRLGGGVVPGREVGEETYAVPPAAFEEHLDAIAAARVAVLGMEELLSLSASRGRGVGGVCLTFDDGNASDYEFAWPALRRRGWPALSFVVPAWIGTTGYLSRSELLALSRGGFCVGAHGFDHTWLATLDDEGIRRQLREARRFLAEVNGSSPLAISLPGGSGGVRAVRFAREEGFQLVGTSTPRLARPSRGLAPFPRFAVRRGDDAGVILALAEQRRGTILWRASRDALLHFVRAVLGEDRYAVLRRRWAGGQGGL